jgi:hypothetical protein
MNDEKRDDEVEKTLRFNSEWLNDDSPDLDPEHKAAVDALPRGNALSGSAPRAKLWFKILARCRCHNGWPSPRVRYLLGRCDCVETARRVPPSR